MITLFEMTSENLINAMVIAVGIGICLMSFLQISSSTHLRKEVRYYFQLFFAMILLYISSHLARQLMDGHVADGIRLSLNIVTFIEFVASGFTAFLMSLLVLVTSKAEDPVNKRTHRLLIGLLVFHILVMIMNTGLHNVYYFDAENVYHRGPIYLLANVAPLIMLLINAWMLIRYKDNFKPKVRKAFWIYIIAPVASIILQSFVYGYQFIIFSTVGAAVYMYSVIVRDLNERYSQQQESAARIGTELRMATSIQASQLPNLFPAFPNRPEFDVFASMTPAKEVGGDFYDFFLVDPDHIGLVIADVSGKGVPAALFMMVSRVLIKAHLQNGESPAEALEGVNDQLCEGNHAHLFVTVWVAVLEISTGKGVAANAGHEHPALRRADGEYELITYRHSPALAALEGIAFREHEFEMHKGDSLFVYTDGVAEATNADHELFGTERMLKALNSKPDSAPEETLSNVMKGIEDFVKGAEQFDDITMMCLRYNGRQETETKPAPASAE